MAQFKNLLEALEKPTTADPLPGPVRTRPHLTFTPLDSLADAAFIWQRNLHFYGKNMENINNITFADQDLIDQYPEIQVEFMREIFKLEPSDYLVTDASTLSDFATSGVELENPPEDYTLCVADKAIVAAIEITRSSGPNRLG